MLLWHLLTLANTFRPGVNIGGLSSYCLSLLVARYLQEQSSGSDVGSLLMGFLDFMGNHVSQDKRGAGTETVVYCKLTSSSV